MRIAIISIINIKHMTMVKKYTSFLYANKIDFDVIYIDKYNNDEEIEAKNRYKYLYNNSCSLFGKIKTIIKFLSFGKKIIKQNHYDYVIIWNTQTALLFCGFLIRKKIKYCINIRDYFMEKNIIEKVYLKRLINKSDFTTISSKKFESFLPNHDYIHIHSVSNIKKEGSFKFASPPLKIAFVGKIRFIDKMKWFLDTMKNDNRFILQFYGVGSNELKEYCLHNEITNVDFKESFEPSETGALIEQSNIINNLYGYNDLALDTAISIRTYYAVFYSKPILLFDSTYNFEYVKNFNIAIGIGDSSSHLPDYIFDCYYAINENAFNDGANAFIRQIIDDEKKFEDVLNRRLLNYGA